MIRNIPSTPSFSRSPVHPRYGPTPRGSGDWRWPDFTPREMACRHCGEGYRWPAFMDALQAARDRVGRPFHILSGHRCGLHNARVGGAPLSQHLRLAADIALRGHDRHALHGALLEAGFTGFGFYTTFIHADLGPARSWYGSDTARTQWRQD
ncbi:D-Ala-D-Ala carboxypeptidase family metallohydrolase [uncultured Algimonas sp.]|uniref:YcbK family protein n=1 Tax=uncultured Algimonas sp. TaxID=1547920 RepID=UPI00261EB224|nr:D-Ala-D-Ala carboxypeptidase family metallohydrolase [uncultured Algimonas sp.]